MKSYWIALTILFAGVSATGLRAAGVLFNYMQVSAMGNVLILLANGFLLYLLGVCLIVLLLQKSYPRRGRHQPANKQRTLLKFIAPALLILALVAVNYRGFPGAFASAEARQQWAYTEFTDYKYAVSDIQNCEPIKARVGNVKTIAPTWGQNVTVRDPGSSGHRGEFTLEVIGDKGTGVANASFHIGTTLYAIKFTYEGKTETLTCDNAGDQWQTPRDVTEPQTWREHIQTIAKDGGSRDVMTDSDFPKGRLRQRTFFYPKDYTLPSEFDGGFAYPIREASGESYIIYRRGLSAPPLPQYLQGTQYTVAPEDIEQAIQLGQAISISQSLSAGTFNSLSQPGGDKFIALDGKLCHLGACIESTILTTQQMKQILNSGTAIPAQP